MKYEQLVNSSALDAAIQVAELAVELQEKQRLVTAQVADDKMKSYIRSLVKQMPELYWQFSTAVLTYIRTTRGTR